MNEKAVPVRSARELAEELLAFREAYAPDNKRFHERGLLVDNGGRGSDQKAVAFTGDDLSALLMDLRTAEEAVGKLQTMVLMAWHEGEKWGESHPLSLCTDRNAAWQVSEAKKESDGAWPRREP